MSGRALPDRAESNKVRQVSVRQDRARTGGKMRIAALDIGGTAIKSGIWNGEALTELREWETNASEGGKALMERVKAILHTCKVFDAIGISTAGQVNTEEGSIHYANDNIPGYTGMPVKKILEQEFGVKAVVENDVKAAALGEMYAGAAKGLSDFLCLTYGTGVGGAIIMGGKVQQGSSYAGGSFGGILVHPEDWRPEEVWSGCYEKYASTTALVRKAREIDPQLDNGRKIFGAMDRREVRQTVDGWIDEIVYGLVTLIHIFNPSHILLGGGIMAQPYVTEETARRVRQRIAPNMRHVSIGRTSLGNQAGLVGIASLAGGMLNP